MARIATASLCLHLFCPSIQVQVYFLPPEMTTRYTSVPSDDRTRYTP